MSQRILKQILYGAFYLLVLAGILWVIYVVALRPAPSCFDNRQNGGETGVDCGGPCISCEIKNLQPISLLPAILFSADRNFSAAAEIRNLNVGHGAKFDYEVNFYDAAGKNLKNIKNTGFIYGGESKSLIDGARITTGIPARAEIKILEPSLIWLRQTDFFNPPHKLEAVNAVIENEQAVVVSGRISNLNNYALSRVIAGAFLVDKLVIKIGASKTLLENLDSFGSQDFKIIIPVRKDLASEVDLEATAQSVFVEVLK